MTEDNLVNFADARDRHIHDLHEKRLLALRSSFEAALPLPPKKGGKTRKKKKSH